ncbi:hypothetical protein CsSME_00030506 [Camellia sinensis var. sinensis]
MVQHPHNDALVVSLQVGECQVKRILIDQDSSCDIMYVRCYKELGLHLDNLEQSSNPMVGFNGTPTWPLGATSVEVQAGTKKIRTEFMVIDTPSPYNIILGRPWLHAMGAVPSTLHQLLRFPTENGIEEVREDQLQAESYSMATMKSTCSIREPKEAEIEDKDMEVLNDVGKEPAEKTEETLKKILVQEGDEERFFLLDSGLAKEEERELEDFLRTNIEVFAWTPYEMPGIDPKVTCHRLNVDRSAKPVIQRARRPTLMHIEAVEEEVDRLLEARAIREVHYPTWLSNTVAVKKKNGK